MSCMGKMTKESNQRPAINAVFTLPVSPDQRRFKQHPQHFSASLDNLTTGSDGA